MKKIASIIFLMFIGILLAIGGGVLLSEKNVEEMPTFSETEEKVSSSSTTLNISKLLASHWVGVDISYDETLNVVTLNGSYQNSGSVGYILQTETLANVQAGKNVALKVEHVGGTVSGGGRVIFMWNLFNEAGESIQGSEREPTITNNLTYFENEITVSATSAYFQLALWRNLDAGGSPTFSNAKFRLTLVYDTEGKKNQNVSINSLLTTSIFGLGVSFNEARSIVTLNGSYEYNGSVGNILQTETLASVQRGKVVGLKAEYVGGTVSGGGRVVFMWDLFNMDGEIIQRSAYEPSIDNVSSYFEKTIEVSATSVYFRLSLWRNLDVGGSPAFSNAQFRLTLIYDTDGKSPQDYDSIATFYEGVTFDYNKPNVNPNLFDKSKILYYGVLSDSGDSFSAPSVSENSYSYFKFLHYRNGVLIDSKSVHSDEWKTGAMTFSKLGENSMLKIGFNGNAVDALLSVDISYLSDGTYTISAEVESLSSSGGVFKNVKLESGNKKTEYTESVKEVFFNSTYGALPSPTRANYRFSGWKLNLSSVGEYFDKDAVSKGRYLVTWANGYWSHPNLIEFVNTSGSTVKVESNYAMDAIYCYGKDGNYLGVGGDYTKEHNIPNGTYFIRFENHERYLSFSNRDALEVVCNSRTIETTTTVNVSHAHTLIANWTPNEIVNTVHLRVINADGSYVDEGNNFGGTVKVEGYQIAGTDSVFKQLENAYSGKTYSVHQGQQFRLTATANDGYVFAGFSKSGSPSDSIKFPKSPPSNVYSDSPESGTNYYVYFKKVSDNRLQYDETDKYFYFEDGYYPQSEANVLENVEASTGTIHGLNIQYDKASNVITLNGDYASEVTGLGQLLVTETVANIKKDKTVFMKIEYLSGQVLGGGRVVFCFYVHNSSNKEIGHSRTGPNLDESSRDLYGDINEDASEGYFKIFIWRNYDNGGAPKFVNAKFRLTISYASVDDSNASLTKETITYNNGTSNVSIPVYSYNGERYVKIQKSGTSAWFKFEPIRWRISDYGVEKTERNISRYQSLLKFKDYTAYSNNFVAVSDLILGVGAMHNTRSVSEGDSAEDMVGFQNVMNTTNGATLNFNYNKTGNIISIDKYSTYSQGNAVNKDSTLSYSEPLRVCSVAELESVGFVNKQARASDMVAFILGVDNDQVSYWTRDLSNLGAGVAISASGTEIRPWLDQVLGMRFAYTFSEGSNLDYYR